MPLGLCGFLHLCLYAFMPFAFYTLTLAHGQSLHCSAFVPLGLYAFRPLCLSAFMPVCIGASMPLRIGFGPWSRFPVFGI